MMQKIIEEDWSFFNQAVRDRATRKPKPSETAPLKLVTPEQPMVPSKPIAAPVRPVTRDYGLGAVIMGGMILLAICLLALISTSSGTRMSTAGTSPTPLVGTGDRTGGTETVVTNYTQFNEVSFGDWRVVTGWKFARSGDALPVSQYCYLYRSTEDEEGGMVHFNIEHRVASGARMPHERPDALVPGLTGEVWVQAAAKCRWHH